MSPVIIVLVGLLAVVIFLAYIGLTASRSQTTIQDRLLEYSARDEPVTLEELELSLPFTQRVLVPMVQAVAEFAARFTPEQTLENTSHMLDLAGNPNNWSAAEFFAIRVVAAGGLGGFLFIVQLIGGAGFINILGFSLAGAIFGFIGPNFWLGSKIRSRQSAVIKALPDALDLLTICVEAGLGFDQAMQKVAQKWDDPLALAFGRVLHEIQLGRKRREALRDMANRLEVSDVTSFVAAVVQAEQLGVSISKILRIQSDQMRVRRRQRAEEKAHQAPVKMLFPLVFLIFPSIWIVLLGPAVLFVMESGALGAVSGE